MPRANAPSSTLSNQRLRTADPPPPRIVPIPLERASTSLRSPQVPLEQRPFVSMVPVFVPCVRDGGQYHGVIATQPVCPHPLHLPCPAHSSVGRDNVL